MLVHNPGIFEAKPFAEIPDADWISIEWHSGLPHQPATGTHASGQLDTLG